jgi:hypothetical protein
VSGIEVLRLACEAPAAPLVVVEQCAGTVTLHDVRATSTCGLADPALLIDSAANVVLDQSRVHGFDAPAGAHAGGAALVVRSSSLYLIDCDVEGGSATQLGTEPLLGAAPGRAGIDSVGSALFLARSRVIGGNGKAWDVALPLPGGEGGPGVRADASSILLASGTGNHLQGGEAAPAGGAVGGNGLALLNGSDARYDEVAVLSGGGSAFGLAPAVAADGTSSAVRLGLVLPTIGGGAARVHLGENLTLELAGDPLAVHALVLGFDQTPWIELPPVHGRWTLSPLTAVGLGFVALDPAGDGGLELPIPVDAELIGAGFWISGYSVSGLDVAFANPTYTVIAP